MKVRRVALIFVTIIVCLAGAFLITDYYFTGAPWWPFHRPKTPHLCTGMVLHSTTNEILVFTEEMGRVPVDLAELDNYFPLSPDRRENRRIDGWGRPLRYVVVQPKLNTDQFDLYSIGENGIDEYDKDGFGDDIHVAASTYEVIHPSRRVSVMKDEDEEEE